MKTIKVFETVDELIHGFQSNRVIDDESVFIPLSLSLIYSNDCLGFIGERSDEFQISRSISYYDLIDRVLEIQGIRFFETKETPDVEK